MGCCISHVYPGDLPAPPPPQPPYPLYAPPHMAASRRGRRRWLSRPGTVTSVHGSSSSGSAFGTVKGRGRKAAKPRSPPASPARDASPSPVKDDAAAGGTAPPGEGDAAPEVPANAPAPAPGAAQPIQVFEQGALLVAVYGGAPGAAATAASGEGVSGEGSGGVEVAGGVAELLGGEMGPGDLLPHVASVLGGMQVGADGSGGGSAASGSSGGSGSPAGSHHSSNSDNGGGGGVNLGTATGSYSSSSVTECSDQSKFLRKLTNGDAYHILRRSLRHLSFAEVGADAMGVLMKALETGLDEMEKLQKRRRGELEATSPVEGPNPRLDDHPQLRADAHYHVAKWYDKPEAPDLEKMERHCRAGVELMYAHEELDTKLVAGLHCLLMEILVKRNEPGMLAHVEEHARIARLALTAAADSELSFSIDRSLGDAHAINTERPPCDSILDAYKNYTAALDVLRIAKSGKPMQAATLGNLRAQLVLRFLRHSRRVHETDAATTTEGVAAARPNACTATSACRRDRSTDPVLRDFTADAAVAMLTKALHTLPGSDTSTEMRRMRCTVEEYLGEALTARSRTQSPALVLRDLRQAETHYERALKLSSWSGDSAGLVYASLLEKIDVIKHEVRCAEAAAPEEEKKDSDEEAEDVVVHSGKTEGEREGYSESVEDGVESMASVPNV